MANLHALPIQTQRNPVVQQVVAANLVGHQQTASKPKWTYLIANSISFGEKADFVITLPKPPMAKLKEWLEKIVISGQCSLLFVEQLSIDEISYRRLRQLCTLHNVSLINLLPNIKAGQVVQGPW